MSQWAAQTELRSRLTGPGFADVTAEWIAADSPSMAQLNPGIDAWRSLLNGASGIDVYGNHGVAVGDIVGSGFDSFYVRQPSGLPSRLYRNKGDGSFEDITEHSGTGILDGTASALFVDFLNRGQQNLLVVRSWGRCCLPTKEMGAFLPSQTRSLLCGHRREPLPALLLLITTAMGCSTFTFVFTAIIRA